jgi:exosome complex protein LRP1
MGTSSYVIYLYWSTLFFTSLSSNFSPNLYTFTGMDATILASLIEDLDDNIDDLEEALAPLIKSALSDTAGKLPVLDRAKLYVIVAYAIESILFCKIL